ncbi:MAG: serine-tRNA(Ala) deacylase AlaX [Phototrophicaceae bacterium]
MTEKLYFADPITTDFSATVLESSQNNDNTSYVVLDKTYFYPTGGGQTHDKGVIAGQAIVDVRKDGDTVIHILEGQAIAEGEIVTCRVDADYRRANTQAHTGQHILSASFLRECSAETVAVKMNATGLSTVDIGLPNLSSEQIKTVEALANQIIMENRSVKSYFVAPDSPKLNELRRSVKFDKVSGDVRLVEIENFDLSACAGTHFPQTGMLGAIKILKYENYKGGSRIYFAVGTELIQQFRQYHHEIEIISQMLSSGVEGLSDLVEKLLSERNLLQKQVRTQSRQLLQYEAQEVLASHTTKIIKLAFENRENSDLKMLASLLTENDIKLVALVNQMDEDMTVIVASSDSDSHAGNILREILSEFDGRGGGRDDYAQGVIKGFSDISAMRRVIDRIYG